MGLALVSDIHGNLPALEAVLADARRRSVDRIVNLGDSLSGPLYPRETADFLSAQDWIQLAGNHERQILEFDPVNGRESDRYALAQLTPQLLEWVAALPGSAALGSDILLCHGTPSTDVVFLLETVDQSGARLASAEEIRERLGPTQAKVVACGHSHVARVHRTADGKLVVNPGSVGLAAYYTDPPFVHRIENGSPDARYAVLDDASGQWSAALISVPYDHEAVARQAARNGRPEWAHALRTGYAPSPGPA